MQNFNYSLLFLSILTLRNTIRGATIGDAIALASVAALYGASLYFDMKKTIPVNDQIKKDVEQLKSSIDGLKVARAYSRT